MTVYLDASVLLRVVLRQRGALREWKQFGSPLASAIIQVECFRTLDRFRLIDGLADDEIWRRGDAVRSALESVHLVGVNSAILARASEPLPSVLGTSDAIHLATALLWREEKGGEVTIATHDAALGNSARAFGFGVIGV